MRSGSSGWWAGLRLSEARHLRWASSAEKPWLDFDGNRIVLPAEFAKAAVDQSVPLHPRPRAALPRDGEDVFPLTGRFGQRLRQTDVSYRVKQLAKEAGGPLTMHQLRKGFGGRVARHLGKGGAAMLHELMRHSSMPVTMDCCANADDALQDAMNGLT